MSTSYWVVEGIGIGGSKVAEHLNKRKVINELIKLFPDDKELLEWRNKRILTDFEPDDYTAYGNCGFNCFSDFLTHLDDTDTLTFGDVGDEDYLYYPPSMPWHRLENEPQSAEEVYSRIVSVVMKITDLTEKEILEMINPDIYEVGCG